MEVKVRGLTRPVPWRGDLYLSPMFEVIEDHPTLPFTVELVAEVYKGEVVCSSLTVNRKQDGPPIVARHLRVLSLPYILEKAAMSIVLKGEEVEGSISLEPALSPGTCSRSGPGRALLPPVVRPSMTSSTRRLPRATTPPARPASNATVTGSGQWRTTKGAGDGSCRSRRSTGGCGRRWKRASSTRRQPNE